MKTFQKVVALIALSGMCMAMPKPSDGDPAAKKHTKHHAVKQVKRDETAEKLRDMKQAIEQQQAATAQLQQQLQQTQQQLQQTQQQLTQATATANAADAKVATVETNTSMQVQKVQSDLSDVKTALDTTTVIVVKDEKKIAELEHPLSIAYKNIRLTPGGFLSFDMVERQKAAVSDVTTPFNGSGLPFNNTANAHQSEFRASARVSRLTLLAETKLGDNKVQGYYEMDFLGVGSTSNEKQTTSFVPRARQLFLQIITPGGWTFSAGQNWSLLTMNRKGIELRSEWIPSTIEAQYVIGWTYGRYGNIRVTKAFMDKKATFGIELDNPAYRSGGTRALVVDQPGQSNSLGANLSVNVAPDLSAKLALDPGFGHYELKALGRAFRSRVGNNNYTTYGYGIGAGAIIPVVKSKVDVIAEVMAGRGIARYAAFSDVDFVTRPNGRLSALGNIQALVGVEVHPTPKLDWYAYAGEEYLDRNYKISNGDIYGYGAKTADVSGCFVPNGACAANYKSLQEVTTGVWYRFYKGSMGTLQTGFQVEYGYKNTWHGTNLVNGIPSSNNDPKASNLIGFTSVRYILP